MKRPAKKRRSPKKRVVQIVVENGMESRLIRNNLPYGLKWLLTKDRERPRWTQEERDRKLKHRAEFVKIAGTIVLTVVTSSATFVMWVNDSFNQQQADIAQLRNELNNLRAATQARADDQQREIQRISSYFGIPAPRNLGRE